VIRECSLSLFSADELVGLINQEFRAIHCRNAFSTSVANSLCRFVDDNDHEVTNYRYSDGHGNLNRSNTGCIGVPLNELYAAFANGKNDDEFQKYEARARALQQELRSCCAPLPLPLDSLKCILDEIWPMGATLAKFKGLKGSPSILRIMRSNEYGSVEESPHVDRIPPYIHAVSAQLSIICYIEMPRFGGELEIWEPSPANYLTLVKNRDSYRTACGPGEVIRPGKGDIVLINTALPHAVRKFDSGRRIVQNVFVGYQEAEKPLILWC
jgi:2OG-Fe(II) oxygenase superfamily